MPASLFRPLMIKHMASGVAGGLLCLASAQANVTIGGTRFVYYDRQQSITVELRNTESSPFLVQSKVISDNGQDSNGLITPAPPGMAEVPFIVTPPLFVLKGEGANKLRMTRVGGTLPEDRESLFWLQVAAIPETPENDSGIVGQKNNSVQIAFRTRLKLFYRPAGLKGSPQQAYQQLTWQRQGAQVTIGNDTPYYVTLFNVSVNGRRINGGMAPPFSQRRQPWCPQTGRCDIRWQTLADSSLALPLWRVSLAEPQAKTTGQSVQ